MIKEVITKGTTIDDAKEKAAKELGVSIEDCSFEILEIPKRSLFGKNKEAQVKASIEVADEKKVVGEVKATVQPSATTEKNVSVKSAPMSQEGKLAFALSYLRDILDAMGLQNIELDVKENEEGATITFNGDGMAVLIGHHGDTLDALQYLVALTCNRSDGDYYRLTLDCGNYREKREATLQGLATRIAAKVKKTGRSQLLEPMNPYERRIIHAIVSEIDGVCSKSKGEEPNRRVVILSETPAKVNFNKNTNRKEDFAKKPYVHKPERTMEEILKGDVKKKVDDTELYSKVEL